MKRIYYQNDFAGLPHVYNKGCLFMSLLDIVQEEFKESFSKKEIESIYHKCNELGYLQKSFTDDSHGAFVMDHIGVLKTASFYFDKDCKWEYSARIYTAKEESKGRTSFINNPDYGSDNYMIFQVRTTAVSGHFRRFNYDPWKFGSKEICLKSVRYYKRVA